MTHQQYQALYRNRLEETRWMLPRLLIGMIIVMVCLSIVMATSTDEPTRFACFISILCLGLQVVISLNQWYFLPPAQPPANPVQGTAQDGQGSV